ncbi:hypothetical protein OF83DRAFT_1179643 [Amylostereum chailletii]|nr:hypothetical protein OF83DRAFT_1179643 [Amylostereum chailletii]
MALDGIIPALIAALDKGGLLPTPSRGPVGELAREMVKMTTHMGGILQRMTNVETRVYETLPLPLSGQIGAFPFGMEPPQPASSNPSLAAPPMPLKSLGPRTPRTCRASAASQSGLTGPSQARALSSRSRDAFMGVGKVVDTEAIQQIVLELQDRGNALPLWTRSWHQGPSD